MKKIEIFKVGSWTSSEGQTIRFTENDLRKTAAVYDPAKFDAPLVLGHPKTDDPAYGWVKNLFYADGKLFAEADDLVPAFSEAVAKKRYKKISASFYAPNHPGNPVPGTYYLRHVGFLGAAAPAVKGLKPVAFAGTADGALTFDFAEEAPAKEARAAGILAKIKELIADKFGEDDAEKAVPAEDLAALEETPAAPETTASADTDEDDEEKKKKESSFAEREAALAKREKELKHAENEQFLDTLIFAGRLMPGIKNKVLNFMDALANGDTLSFAEKADTFREILTAMPKIIEFSEKSKPETPSSQTASFSAPEGYAVNADRLEIHQKITAYQEAHPGVSYAEALKKIGG